MDTTATIEAPPPAATEAPAAPNPFASLEAKLPASSVAFLEQHFAETDPADDKPDPTETPEALPDTEVEPSTDAVPGEATNAAPAKIEPVPPNAAVQPAPWQPGDDERQLAQSLGLDEGDVRGFRSAEAFYRMAAKLQARLLAQNAAGQAASTTPTT